MGIKWHDTLIFPSFTREGKILSFIMVRLVVLLFLCGAVFARDLILLERELSGSDLELRATYEGKLTSSEKTAVLEAHNDARANVEPSAANMVALVSNELC